MAGILGPWKTNPAESDNPKIQAYQLWFEVSEWLSFWTPEPRYGSPKLTL